MGKLTRNGAVNDWFSNFKDTFESFGTPKSPLPPSQYCESKMFIDA